MALRRHYLLQTWSITCYMDLWTPKDHFLIPEMIEISKGTPVKELFSLKGSNIFDLPD